MTRSRAYKAASGNEDKEAKAPADKVTIFTHATIYTAAADKPVEGGYLVVKGGKDWEDWDTRMVKGLEKAQDKDGSWAGQHCITGKTFCTAGALLVLTADRTPFSVDVIKAAKEKKDMRKLIALPLVAAVACGGGALKDQARDAMPSHESISMGSPSSSGQASSSSALVSQDSVAGVPGWTVWPRVSGSARRPDRTSSSLIARCGPPTTGCLWLCPLTSTSKVFTPCSMAFRAAESAAIWAA